VINGMFLYPYKQKNPSRYSTSSIRRAAKFEQESLADAKVSARQQCVYIAKKSTANQRYAISYRLLIVTVAALLTVCKIFSCVEVENRHFRTLYSDCRPLAEERPAIST